jgi:uncharacterized Tic20 family protein
MPAKKKVHPPVEPVEAILPPVEPVLHPPMPKPPMPPVPYNPPQTMAPGDERTWALIAHLSVLTNLITGFLGPVVALLIYLIYKDRSRYVAYQSLQAFIFQLIWWGGAGVLIGFMWAVTGVLSALLVGILLIPIALLLTPVFLLMPLGSLIYGIIGGVQTSQGQDFKYWLVGDWVRGTLTGA